MPVGSQETPLLCSPVASLQLLFQLRPGVCMWTRPLQLRASQLFQCCLDFCGVENMQVCGGFGRSGPCVGSSLLGAIPFPALRCVTAQRHLFGDQRPHVTLKCPISKCSSTATEMILLIFHGIYSISNLPRCHDHLPRGRHRHEKR